MKSLCFPVTIGGVRDESGNDNDFIQATAANKPTWTADEGIKAVDAADHLSATFGSTLSDFTVIVRLKDPGSATATAYQNALNSNNQIRVRINTTTVQGYMVQAGISTNSLNIKTGLSDGSVNTVVLRYNDTSGEAWGTFNDETPVTFTRTPPDSWGTIMRLCGTNTAEPHLTPVHRIIMLNRALTDAEVETAKTMAQNGWVA